LVFPIFIAVVLATLQAATIFLVEAFFESAAEQAARIVLTNQTGSLTAAQFQTQVCNQLTALFTCAQVIVELEPLPAGTTNLTSLLPQFNASGSLASTPPVDVGAGTPGEDMLSVAALWRPARPQFRQPGQRPNADGVDPGLQNRAAVMVGKILSERSSRLGRAFLTDIEGLAAIEMAQILPVAVHLMSLIVYGGQVYTVQRKVTLGATTVANLMAQGNNNGQATVTAAELAQILAYPSLILYPHNGSGVAVVVSQVLVTANANGTATGTVCASWPNANGTARPTGQ
jgi:Flp pilus assembly protein TadG